jgi:formylglycine-generating enzyme required for sulfatase activity
VCEYGAFLAERQEAAFDESRCAPERAQFPAVNMTWADAKAFCTWLSGWTHKRYRLPSESEYERTMRVLGSGTEYTWGNTEFSPEKPGVALANYAAAWSKRGPPQLVPVRRFPSVGGVYDISGNIWEWTGDWYDPSFYKSPLAREPNCKGPNKSAIGQVVVRGGSFEDLAYKLTCGFRGGVGPDVGHYNVGFRVLREP